MREIEKAHKSNAHLATIFPVSPLMARLFQNRLEMDFASTKNHIQVPQIHSININFLAMGMASYITFHKNHLMLSIHFVMPDSHPFALKVISLSNARLIKGVWVEAVYLIIENPTTYAFHCLFP